MQLYFPCVSPIALLFILKKQWAVKKKINKQKAVKIGGAKNMSLWDAGGNSKKFDADTV